MFRTHLHFVDRFLFSQSQMNKIIEFLYPYRLHVDSNYAGHIHETWHDTVRKGLFSKLYDVCMTDKTWYYTQENTFDDKKITLRWVKVTNTKDAIHYTQHLMKLEPQ